MMRRQPAVPSTERIREVLLGGLATTAAYAENATWQRCNCCLRGREVVSSVRSPVEPTSHQQHRGMTPGSLARNRVDALGRRSAHTRRRLGPGLGLGPRLRSGGELHLRRSSRSPTGPRGSPTRGSPTATRPRVRDVARRNDRPTLAGRCRSVGGEAPRRSR